MKGMSVILWNNLNVLLCSVCIGFSIACKDWNSMAGWLSAAIAWQQSNFHRMWMGRWEELSSSAIHILEVFACIKEKNTDAHSCVVVPGNGVTEKTARSFFKCVDEAVHYLNEGTTTFMVSHGGIEIKVDVHDEEECDGEQADTDRHVDDV